LKFGLLYNTDYRAEVHGPPARYYAQILEQVQLAETLGYDSVWFGEHHYSGYSFGSPPVIATAAAARTRRIRLGTGVSLLPLHHPLRLAAEYALLDVLSGGRLDYGIGRGFLQYAYQLLGVDPAESRARYEEAGEVIVRAWTARGPFSHHGRFWSFDDYEFFPPPLQRPHPPIYASGVLSPESQIWAARHGFHLATACFVPDREGVRKGVQLYRDTLIGCGHDPAQRDVAGVFQMYCGESDQEALDTSGGCVVAYLQFFSGLSRRGAAPQPPGSGGKPLAVGDVYSELTADTLDENRLVLIGAPDKLIERVHWARDFYGLNYLLLEVGQGGLPHERVVTSLERFARRVMPAFGGAIREA
jgi:alkanesulfonate monooxygenase SsuD/methylene tetrahydromethanopterin reductase-like flavin-dependent oxidoreductase (luciferase family)